MEAVMMEQTIYAHKQTRTPRKNTRAFSHSRPSDQNLAPANFHGGFLNAPLQPSLSFSYSPSASLLPHQYPQLQQQRNPPLLPLPIPMARNHSLPPPTRGLSLPPPNRKMNKPRDHSVTPKKSKSKSSNSKMEESKPDTDIRSMSSSLIVASTHRFGPDPNNLPKNVSKALLPSPSLGTNQSFCSVLVGDLEKFSGSVFSLAPPPSSLPVPKFMLRSKLSCKAQTAGVDAGATDNLCRLLRLR